jgi:5-methylcytosine-specific restriction protein A
MTNRIAVPCLGVGCPNIAVARGRCTLCNRRWERQRGTASERGYGYAWQQLRRRILARSPTCEVPGCQSPSQEVDHIIPKVMGGTDDPSNLRATCRYCNRSRAGRRPAANKWNASSLTLWLTFSRARSINFPRWGSEHDGR